MQFSILVIPAKAGTHLPACRLGEGLRWVPAFAGMTVKGQVL